ncbi:MULTISPECIES: hypothetical protein [unclassified Lysinibacillus]|uniref:hypothetical protein n=1 Tax=unclassified Lysinibacillus TaxID=2636778 RepID=UPI0038099061
MEEVSSLALTVTNACEYVGEIKKRKANVLKKHYSKRWLFISSEIRNCFDCIVQMISSLLDKQMLLLFANK